MKLSPLYWGKVAQAVLMSPSERKEGLGMEETQGSKTIKESAQIKLAQQKA